MRADAIRSASTPQPSPIHSPSIHFRPAPPQPDLPGSTRQRRPGLARAEAGRQLWSLSGALDRLQNRVNPGGCVKLGSQAMKPRGHALSGSQFEETPEAVCAAPACLPAGVAWLTRRTAQRAVCAPNNGVAAARRSFAHHPAPRHPLQRCALAAFRSMANFSPSRPVDLHSCIITFAALLTHPFHPAASSATRQPHATPTTLPVTPALPLGRNHLFRFQPYPHLQCILPSGFPMPPARPCA